MRWLVVVARCRENDYSDADLDFVWTMNYGLYCLKNDSILCTFSLILFNLELAQIVFASSVRRLAKKPVGKFIKISRGHVIVAFFDCPFV